MDRKGRKYPEQFDFSGDAELFRASLLRRIKADTRRISREDAELVSAAGDPFAAQEKQPDDDKQ